MRVSVLGSKELQATILLLEQADTSLRKEIYGRARAAILPEWNEMLLTRLGTTKNHAFRSRLYLNTRVRTGTDRIGVEAATRGTKTVSGGLVPSHDYYLAEFGATPRDAEVRGRRGNTTYTYTRKINTWSDGRSKKGAVAYPVAQMVFARVLKLWVSTVVRTYYDAFDGKL